MANKKPNHSEDNPIDKLFREGLENREYPFEESYWTEAEKTLADFNAKTGKSNRKWWWFGGAAVIAIIGVTFFTMQHRNDEPIAQSTQNEFPVQPSHSTQKNQNDTLNNQSSKPAISTNEIRHNDAHGLRDVMKQKLREKREVKKKSEQTKQSSNSSKQSITDNHAAKNNGEVINSENLTTANAEKNEAGSQLPSDGINKSTENAGSNMSNTESIADGQSISDNNQKIIADDPAQNNGVSTNEAETNNKSIENNNGIVEPKNGATIDPQPENNNEQNNNANPDSTSNANKTKPSQFKTRKSSIDLKWFIGAQGGANYAKPTLKGWDGNSIPDFYMFENPSLLSATGELYTGFTLPNIPFSLQTGFSWAQMQEQITPIHTLLMIDTTWDYLTDTNGLVIDSVALIDTNDAYYHSATPSKLYYYQIPLMLGYTWQFNKFSVGVTTGPVLSIKSSTVAETFAAESIFYDKSIWYWRAQPQFGYALSDHLNFTATGNFQWQLNNTWTNTDLPFESRYQIFGLQLGVKYTF